MRHYNKAMTTIYEQLVTIIEVASTLNKADLLNNNEYCIEHFPANIDIMWAGHVDLNFNINYIYKRIGAVFLSSVLISIAVGYPMLKRVLWSN